MQKRNDFRIITEYRTAIMGFAALWIYIFHLWNPLIKTDGVLKMAEEFITQIGYCGVDIFFFLSGIGLVYAIEKNTTGVFYKRRLIKVLPPFLLIAVCKIFTDGWTFWDFVKNITGYNFLTESIYVHLWFVPAILFLYLIFPLYYKVFSKMPNKLQFTLVILVVWWFVSVYLENRMRIDLYGVTNRWPVFLVGVLVGWSLQKREIMFTKLTWILWGCICVLGFYFAHKTNRYGMYLMVTSSNCCVPTFLLATSGCCLLAKGFSLVGGKVRKILVGFFEFFGRISLEFYCVQEWVGWLVINWLRDYVGTAMLNLITFVAVLLAALILAGICKMILKLAHRPVATV